MRLNKFHRNINITDSACTIYVSHIRCCLDIFIGFFCGPIFIILAFLPLSYKHPDTLFYMSLVGCFLSWFAAYSTLRWMHHKHLPLILTDQKIILPDGKTFFWKEGLELKFVQYPIGTMGCYIISNSSKYQIIDWGRYIDKHTFIYLFEKYKHKYNKKHSSK